MFSSNLEICLGEKAELVGRLQYGRDGQREYSCFQYAQSWLASKKAFALAPALTLDEGQKFFSGERPLPPVLMDTLPDSWGRRVLTKYARLTGLKTMRDSLFFLINVSDFHRSGALRIRYEGGGFLAETRSEVPRWSDLGNMKRLAELMELGGEEEIRHDFLGAGSSLGGVRPKCSILDERGSLAVAKFTSRNDLLAVEKAEVLTLKLARLCGLNAPEAELIQEGVELPVAVITRFDRGPGGRKLFISGQTLLDAPVADDGSYTEMADAIRQYSWNPAVDLKELFQRVLFNILVSNVDDHLKNHGFLLAGRGRWALSPVFDVNPFPERLKRLKTRIAEGGDDSASVEILLEHAFYFELPKDEAAGLAGKMAKVIQGHWRRLGKTCGMSGKEIDEYSPAFEHEEAAAALKLKAVASS